MRLVSIWRKAQSFRRAIWSFIRWGDVSIREYDRRMLTCMACEFVVYKPKPPEIPTGMFCGVCGCPESPVSDRRSTARMRDAACPKYKW
jgi:hypothetical protein